MSSKKPKGINDRVSEGFIIESSENIFQVRTHRMQNVSDAQEKEKENFHFSRQDSKYFNPIEIGSKVHVVFNNPSKEYIESIYNSRWNLIYIPKKY